jgi:hypothetical protein
MPERYGLKVKTWIIGAILSMRLDHVFVERNHRCHGGIAQAGLYPCGMPWVPSRTFLLAPPTCPG